MAKGNETTTKFKVDISELKKSMQEARKQVAYANSEFKATASSMDDWSKSSDGISAKLKQLNSNLKSQKAVLAEYEKTLEEVKKEYGENSKEALEYDTKLNNQKAVVNKIKSEIANYKDALTEVSKAEKIAAKTGKDVSDVLDDMRSEAEDAGDGFTTLKGAVATFAGNVMTSLVSGLKDAVVNLMSLSDETREYRTELAKIETAAQEAGASTDYIKDKWHDMGAVLGDEGAVAEGLNNLLAAGFTTQKEMDAITSHLEGAAIKWKDTLKFEGLSDGLQETLATSSAVGSFGEMLERSGVNLDTFNAGLAECVTEADKQNYVLQELSKLGLNELSSAYRSQNKDLIAANRANSDYTDTLAEMGAKIEPVTTTLKEGFNGLLQELLKLVGDVDMEAFTAKIKEGFGVLKDDVLPAVKEGFGWILANKDSIIAGLAGIAAGFVAFKVVTLIQGVQKAMQGMTVAQYALNLAMSLNPIGILIALIAGLVAAFVVLWNKSETFRQFWINIWENIKSACGIAFEAIGKFFTEKVPEFLNKGKELFVQFIDNTVTFFKELPVKIKEFLYQALVAITSTLIAIPVLAYRHGKEFLENLISFFKQLPSKIWTWLTSTITKIVEWKAQMKQKAKEAALEFINKVVEFVKQLPEKVWTWLTNTITKITTWKNNLGVKAREAGQELLDKLINKVKEIPDKIKSIGGDIVAGLWNGITDKVAWLKEKIGGFVGDVTQFLKDKFQIGSPSKLMAKEVGKWLPEGIAVGVSDNAKSVLNAMKDVAVTAVGGARAGLKTATTSLGGSSAIGGGVVNNFYQTINSPKQLSRLDIYRQSKNLLGYAGGGV